jgi:hypothetical protein
LLPTEARRSPAARLGVAALIGGALLGGFGLVHGATSGHHPAPAPAPAPVSASAVEHVDAPAPSPVVTAPPAAPSHVAQPVRVVIPAIGVRARVIRLGLHPDGTLEVPADVAETGWWSGGSRPGEPGPAVIAGHVDSRTGPGVFYRLGKLRRGDVIRIGRSDGSVARFAVQRIASYPKARFPTRQVYGSTPGPTLRVITCSGDFDRSTGHYLDNTVVYAAPVPSR